MQGRSEVTLVPQHHGTKSPRTSWVMPTCPEPVWVAAIYFNSLISLFHGSFPFLSSGRQDKKLL